MYVNNNAFVIYNFMTPNNTSYYKESYDLQNCDQEPIHRIRRAQEYGSFICCNQDGSTWYHASENIINDIENSSISDFILEQTGISFNDINPNSEAVFYSDIKFPSSILVHTTTYGYQIEIEPTMIDAAVNSHSNPYQDVIIQLAKSTNKDELLNEVIQQVYKITGYDQIMIYEFDEEYCGEVVAEKKIEAMPSYLGLKFPASDIPEQARRLFFSEQVRIINNTALDGHVIRANENNEPIDLDISKVSMRGVSPIHREYLQNMGVGASFSVAIIEDEKLWGLIACHNRKPNFIGYNTRSWLKFISEFISINKNKLAQQSNHIKNSSDNLLKSKIMVDILESKDLIQSILNKEESIRQMLLSDGLIIKSGDTIKGTGIVPKEELFEELSEWLNSAEKFDIRSFNKTKEILPKSLHNPLWAGMLILQLSDLSKDYLIWTRKEKLSDITWAGDPTKTKSFNTDKGRMSPRKSFDKWKETVHDRANPWTESEILLAKDLKSELREHLYRKYNEMLLLNKELEEAYKQMESFSYSVSHDLKAPLRSIEGFSQILLDDYSEHLDDYGIKLLNTINNCIVKMKSFIKEVLNYSKINNSSIEVTKIDINKIIESHWTMIQRDASNEPQLIFDGSIPDIYGDILMVTQIVVNLLTNSTKYVDKGVTPKIKISHTLSDNLVNINVEDNGFGIPEEQRDRVFDVFRRFVNEDDYEGSGVGLSIVKRVIERHHGRINIKDSTLSPTGVCFVFSLPSTPEFVEIMKGKK